MTTIKLAKLPDRTPIKLTVAVPPDLHQSLQDYARLYAASYGTQVSAAELVPAILAAFLDGDRGFRSRKREA